MSGSARARRFGEFAGVSGVERVGGVAALTQTASHTSAQDSRSDQPTPQEWVDAWTVALDELELDVEQAEQLLHSPEDFAQASIPPQLSNPGPDQPEFDDDQVALASVSYGTGAGGAAADGTLNPDWQAPDLPCPLPPELADRATELLNRQFYVAELLAKAMIGNRQHNAMIGKLERGHPEPRAIYIDQSC